MHSCNQYPQTSTPQGLMCDQYISRYLKELNKITEREIKAGPQNENNIHVSSRSVGQSERSHPLLDKMRMGILKPSTSETGNKYSILIKE